MNLRKLVFLSLATISLQAFAKGGGHSGGGMGTIRPDGRVSFLDLTSPNELPNTGMETNGIIKKFFSSNRYVKAPAKANTDFFNCAIERFNLLEQAIPVLKQHPADALVWDSLNLKSVNVLDVEFRLIPVKSVASAETFILPILATYNTDAPESIQEPLAAYANGRLWVARRFYEALTSVDKCGLSVHEALRQLNFSNLLNENLSTKEIEIATRYIMGVPRSDDDYGRVINKLKDTKLTAEDYLRLAKEAREKATAIGDHSYVNWTSLTQKEVIETRAEEVTLLNQSTDYVTKSVNAILNSPDVKKIMLSGGILQSVALDNALTKKLGAFQYFDTVETKIVNRLSP